MSDLYYDVVVIGGGIHGAGVAQAAAAKGYRVLVLEQTGIGSGTSSRSSKLIHGGLRYLETAQFSLVRESLREREWLIRIANRLVKRIPFYIPIYKTSFRNSPTIATGLSLYALLGRLGEHVRFKVIPKSQWGNLDGIDTTDLCTVYQYWDAQTDDQALTQAVMNSAQTLGATLCLPAQFERAHREGDAFQLSYFHEGGRKQCKARTLINAAGPWVKEVLNRITPRASQIDTALVQGTHIIVDGEMKQGIYYMEAPADKRPVFVIPWKNRIMVGTTETTYTGDPAKVSPSETEMSYLLETLALYFPKFRTLKKTQIESAFAGLRVLPSGPGTFGTRPRETVLEVDDPIQPRLLTIYGGKLTTYRLTAQKVMGHLLESLPKRGKKADPLTLELRPGNSDQ